jgi:site-specific DNA recombinase
VIHENHIEVLAGRSALRRVLDNGGDSVSANPDNRGTPIDANDLIRLTIDAKRKRCGGEVHLVVPPNSAATASNPQPSLVKAVARAHGWYETVLAGKALDQRSLARQAGLTERYIGKVFACAFLAPDIVEAILAGRQPRDLNFERLCKHIPLSWAEQRKQFGFHQAC